MTNVLARVSQNACARYAERMKILARLLVAPLFAPMFVILIFTFALVSFTPLAKAFNSPLSVNIIPPVQFPSSEFSVTGARVSALWGKHRDVYGIDLGLIGNMTEQRFVGLAVSGLFNQTSGETTILLLQGAIGANLNVQKTAVYGIQLAALNKNDAESKLVGLGLGLVNLSPNMSIYGFQAGLFNTARSVYGFQIGIINQTNDLHGLQIGLLNFATNGPFAVSPILNIGW